MSDTEKPVQPVQPGPHATDAERRKYAEDMAAWSESHPGDSTDEDDDESEATE